MFGKRRRQKKSAPQVPSQTPSQIFPQALAPLADQATLDAVVRGPLGLTPATPLAPSAPSTSPADVSTAALAMLVRQQPIEHTDLDRKAEILTKLQARPAGHSNTLPAVLRPDMEQDATSPAPGFASTTPPTGLSNIPPWHRLPV